MKTREEVCKLYILNEIEKNQTRNRKLDIMPGTALQTCEDRGHAVPLRGPESSDISAPRTTSRRRQRQPTAPEPRSLDNAT